MGDVIVVDGLSKRFRHLLPDRPMTLQELCIGRHQRREAGGWFWALDDVSFRVGRGRAVGIVGQNGAGKSTLLRLLCGVGRPDAGRILIDGRVSALLEIGTCFHSDLTGRENAYVAGVVSGLTRREVTSRLDFIVDFSELAEFIDDPVRTYSAGMKMRLAFAVTMAVQRSPEVLVIDEVLAVGDTRFQNKCVEHIRQIKSEGASVLLVSHDPARVEEFCDEAIWLRSGRIAAQGRPADVVRAYRDDEPGHRLVEAQSQLVG